MKNQKSLLTGFVVSIVLITDLLIPLYAEDQSELGQSVNDTKTENSTPLTEEEQGEVDSLVNKVIERGNKKKQNSEKLDNNIPTDVIRVNHVPESIKKEIRDQIREELRKDVVKDVINEAEKEEWGVPGALPGWIKRIKVTGDMRIRGQADLFSDSNIGATYVDVNVVNDAGGQNKAGPEQFINTTEDRHRARVRARLGITADIADGLLAGMRISTGKTSDPVSTNQTLGNHKNKYNVVWDRAYLKYTNYDFWRYPWFSLSAGRIPNPWISTDLVWDSDLSFEGLVSSIKYGFGSSEYNNKLKTTSANIAMTLGAFPLQEIELSSEDKWLYGLQLSSKFKFTNNTNFKIALSYYVYDNITGVRNTSVESTLMDYTAPEYMQKGNLLYNIRLSNDPDAELWALAAEYEEVNLTMLYDINLSTTKHILLTADIVKNIGYDEDDILELVQGEVTRSQGWNNDIGPTDERTLGYQLGVTYGWNNVNDKYKWNVSLFYKHLERDAVLDAFTDSDFHLGGTDAEGWILSAKYGLQKNSWLTFRAISSDTIDGVAMDVDTIQLDWNAKF
jgi:hypothetical protein